MNMRRIWTVASIVWMEMLRKKDIYVLLILLGAMLVGIVSLDIFGLGGVAGYVKDTGLLLAWLFSWIMIASISTRELPQEEARGTIFSLLAKPVRRIELLIGKWLGCWSVAAAATLTFYALVAAVVILKGGRFSYVVLLQSYILHVAALAVIAGVGMAMSTRMNYDAACAMTYVATGAAYLILPRVSEFLTAATGPRGVAMVVLYYLAPHFELFDMRRRFVHDYGVLHWGVFAAILAYGLLYTGLLLMISWLSYRRKRFVRGSLG